MDRANSGGPAAPAPQDGAGRESPRKKKKKVSVGRTILGIIGRIVLTLFTLCVIGVLTVGIFFKIFMTYIDTTLIPSLGEISFEEMTMSLASTIYATDKNGNEVVLQTLYDNRGSGGNRELIEYSDLPDHLIKALVAIEDHRFWEHKGVDWKGTGRAILSTLTGSGTQGGSTITQQLLRSITEDNEVTVKRKFREIFRALEFEKTTSKEDILTMYLNRVYFGGGYYGIQTAAKGYFGKDVSELDLAESAAIVGITNNPSLYDPFRDAKFEQKDGSIKTPRDFNKQRQETILNRMLELGVIDEATCQAAKAEKLLFTDTDEYKALHGIAPDPEEGEETDTSNVYTWFVDQVINDAIDLLAETKGVGTDTAATMLYNAGYHIYTTVDLDMQAIVDSVYQDPSNFDYPSKKGTPLQSAITIVDPYTGDVKAVAGGVGEKTENRSLSLATSRRPCGSAIKPVSVYAPAIEYDVVSPVSIIDDYPISINPAGTGGYPRNSNGRYQGPMTVAYGVQWSINTVAARVVEKVGYSRSFEFMENNLGFDLDPRDLGVGSLAMGGLTYGVTTEEMAAAFGAFANNGIYTKPRTVTRIESNDHTEVVVDNAPQSRVAMKESTAYLMNKMLKSVVSGGTGGSAGFSGMTIAGKTGTTSNNFDRYFVGYTPYYSAAVWIGYKDGNEKINASGNPAAKIWKQIMEPVHAGLENRSFPDKPESGISSATVCADTGLKPGALCGRTTSGEVQSGWSAEGTCDGHVEVRVCTDPATGDVHLAGNYCPEETVSTRIMLKGREHLVIGGPILAEDSGNHMSYFSSKGTCPIHDENYVPEPGLPGEEGETGDGPGVEPGGLNPGDTSTWPQGPWTPPDTQKPDTPPDAAEPSGDPEPGGQTESPEEPDEEPDDRTGTGEPQEPDEPNLPDEPAE
ncbi:MAG: PBP1A family penicillin-binding protein [Oscillospiraceae bacterium]|nr:PBP1A family penicillin-binding protein [Oscillospiraceae bacterium]